MLVANNQHPLFWARPTAWPMHGQAPIFSSKTGEPSGSRSTKLPSPVVDCQRRSVWYTICSFACPGVLRFARAFAFGTKVNIQEILDLDFWELSMVLQSKRTLGTKMIQVDAIFWGEPRDQTYCHRQ